MARSVVVMTAPAMAGTATFRERIAPASQPPFRFSIPYKERDVTTRGRYTVRATVRHQGRLLFSTDTITPVLDGKKQPLELLLKQVGAQDLLKVYHGRPG